MIPVVDPEIHFLCVYVSVLAFVGACGNVVILAVYSKRKDRRATNVFIRALAGLDLIVCVVVMPYTIVYEYHLVTSEFACKVCELTRHFNVSMSNLTLVAVATERYIAICKPTFTVTAVHVQKGLLVMVAISIAFSIPSPFIFAVVIDEPPESAKLNASTYNSSVNPENLPDYCRFTSAILGPTPTLAYQGFQMIMWFGCTVTIIVLYVILYRIVWKRDRARNLARVRPAVWVSSQTDAQQSGATVPNRTFFSRVFHPGPPNNNVNMPSAVDQVDETEVSQSMELSAATSRQPAAVILARKTEHRINAHRKTGTMLFLCTVVYIVTWTPFWLDIFGATKSIAFRHMFFISNASNPVIYGIVNKQVRHAISLLICGRKKRAT